MLRKIKLPACGFPGHLIQSTFTSVLIRFHSGFNDNSGKHFTG